jgi:hypothetical protein
MLAVTDKDTAHALDSSAAPSIAQSAATQWYEQQRQALGTHSLLSTSAENWAITHSGLPQVPPPTPTPPASAPTMPSNSTLPGSGPQPPAPSEPAAPAVPPAPNGTP